MGLVLLGQGPHGESLELSSSGTEQVPHQARASVGWQPSTPTNDLICK